MKSILVLGLAVLTFSANAIHCNTYEAQVKGTITNVMKSKSVCTYTVKVEDMNHHILCPLLADEVESSIIKGACTFSKGDSFYRIIVKDEQHDFLIFD